ARPAAANALQQRVTALDRSTERFSLQIAEAYNLLNIDSDSVGSIPCSEPKAWILLRIVVARLPLTVTARLLNAHKFMSTIQKTLDWLCLYVSDEYPAALASNDERNRQVPLSRQSSSSTTVQEMPTATSKKSKKRKRGQPDPELLTEEGSPIVDPILLHVAICGTLGQIAAFTNDKPGEAENFAAEHIKAAIKTPIEQGAKILGKSLKILAHIIGVPNNSSYAVNYDIFLRSIVDVWSLRSTFQETNDGFNSAQAFSVHCLVPALRLLLKIQCTSFQDERRSITQIAEKLIAAHVILPGRTAFLRAKSSDGDESQISVIKELLSPLSRVVILEAQDTFSITDERNMINTMPMLFKLALKLLPRDTPKQRITEAPWHRALFIELTECLSLRFPLSEVSTASNSVIDALESLLHLLVENNVSMDIPILESIVLYISGIYPAEARQVKWSLVGLCMEICPDLAISVRSNSNLRTGRATSKSNTVLNGIVDNLTSLSFRDGDEISSDYYVMLDTVVLRLLKCFINARDLLGFIKIWEQQIGSWESARVSNSDSGEKTFLAASIWDDEALLQTISEQLEQVLTTSQVSKLLDNLGSKITSDSDALAVSPLEPYAQVVVLDCVLDGVRSDSVIRICKTAIESIGRKLTTILKINDALFVPHRWRVWRLLANMAARFSHYQDDMFSYAEGEIALGLAEDSSNLPHAEHDYADTYAFGFLISAQEAQKNSNQNEERSGIVCRVIRALVDCIPSDPPPEKKDDSHVSFTWNGKRGTVITRPMLLLAYAAQLTLVPKVLSDIEVSVLDSFLHIIYRHAAHFAVMGKTLKGIDGGNTSITFMDVWEELVDIGMAGELPSIAKVILQIVYDAFVQTRAIDRNEVRVEEEEYAVSVINRISLGAFEREQREHVIRHLSDKLLEHSSLPDFPQYVALLVRSLDYPKKSMHLLLSDPAYLWNLADRIDSGSERRVSSSVLISFKQLATKAIQIMISDCAESESTSFLDPFLDHLNKPSLASESEMVALARYSLRAVSQKLLWRRYDALPEQLKVRSPSLLDTSQELFGWLPNCLTQWEAGQEDWVLSVFFDVLEICLAMLNSGLFQTLSELHKSNVLSQINQMCESSKKLMSQKGLPQLSTNTTSHSIENLVVVAKKIEASLSSHGLVMSTTAITASINE
ncbi:hypothetical protein MMC26_000767, partial [Xylographa opegraphella]|nr:hypothetical protein [Xylographa opegraphella]